MDDRQRIEALERQGRITREEAQRLISVLDEIDSTETELGQIDSEVRTVSAGREEESGGPSEAFDPTAVAPKQGAATGSPSQAHDQAPEQGAAPVPPVPAAPDTPPSQRAAAAGPIPPAPEASSAPKAPSVPESPPAPDAPSAPEAPAPNAPDAPPAPPTSSNTFAGRSRNEPAGLRWLEIDMLAGELTVESSPSTKTPSVVSQGAGESRLEEIEDGYRLGVHFGKGEGSVVDRLLNYVGKRSVDVTLPEGWGLRLSMKAGEVDIRGPVAFLSGQLLAGDLDARELHGIDLDVGAADVDLSLRLSEGSHRIKGVAADVDVRLLHGSDVRVEGRVSIGDAKVPSSWRSSSRGMGADFDHTVGAGRATLRLDMGTSSVKVREADV